MIRRSTVLPLPLPPMTARTVPWSRDRLTPRSTSLCSKAFHTSRTSTMAMARRIRPYQKRTSKSLVRKKSEMITPIATCTTVAVVDRPRPSVPPVVTSPL